MSGEESNQYDNIGNDMTYEEESRNLKEALNKHQLERHNEGFGKGNKVSQGEQTNKKRENRATIITQVEGPNYRKLEEKHLESFVQIIKDPGLLMTMKNDPIYKRVGDNLKYNITYGTASANQTRGDINNLRKIGNSHNRALSSIQANMASSGRILMGIGKNARGRSQKQKFSHYNSKMKSASYANISSNSGFSKGKTGKKVGNYTLGQKEMRLITRFGYKDGILRGDIPQYEVLLTHSKALAELENIKSKGDTFKQVMHDVFRQAVGHIYNREEAKRLKGQLLEQYDMQLSNGAANGDELKYIKAIMRDLMKESIHAEGILGYELESWMSTLMEPDFYLMMNDNLYIQGSSDLPEEVLCQTNQIVYDYKPNNFYKEQYIVQRLEELAIKRRGLMIIGLPRNPEKHPFTKYGIYDPFT
jgi:hypothetical protein